METYLEKTVRIKKRARKAFDATIGLLVANTVIWFVAGGCAFMGSGDRLSPDSHVSFLFYLFFSCLSLVSLWVYLSYIFRLFGIKKGKSRARKEREEDMHRLETITMDRWRQEVESAKLLVKVRNSRCPECFLKSLFSDCEGKIQEVTVLADKIGAGLKQPQHVRSLPDEFFNKTGKNTNHCSNCGYEWPETDFDRDKLHVMFWDEQLKEMFLFFSSSYRSALPSDDEFKSFKAKNVKKFLWERKDYGGYMSELAFLSVKDLIRYGCQP